MLGTSGPSALIELRAVRSEKPSETVKAALADVLLENSLGEGSRRTRRALLGVSVSVLLLRVSGADSSGLEVFGITLSELQITPHQLLWLLGAIVAYFLLYFLAESLPELVSWRGRVISKGQKALQEYKFLLADAGQTDRRIDAVFESQPIPGTTTENEWFVGVFKEFYKEGQDTPKDSRIRDAAMHFARWPQ